MYFLKFDSVSTLMTATEFAPERHYRLRVLSRRYIRIMYYTFINL